MGTMRFEPKKHKRGADRAKWPVRRYLAYLLVLTSLLCGVTFSRYVASTSGGDSARVAAFGDVKLVETTGQHYIITPGVNLQKDPTVAYAAERRSEMAAYVFVTVTAEGWTYDGSHGYTIARTDGKALLSWSVPTEWTYLTQGGGPGTTTAVFYRLVPAGEKLSGVPVVQNGEITVSKEIYASEMDDVEKAAGGIDFQAYAVQAGGFESALAAWESVSAH